MIDNLPHGFGVGSKAQFTAEEIRKQRVGHFVDTVKSQRLENGFDNTYDHFLMDYVGLAGSHHFPPLEAPCGRDQAIHSFNRVLFSSFVQLGEDQDILLLHGRQCHGSVVVALANLMSGDMEVWDNAYVRHGKLQPRAYGEFARIATQVEPVEGASRAVLLMPDKFYWLQIDREELGLISLDTSEIRGELDVNAKQTTKRLELESGLVSDFERLLQHKAVTPPATPPEIMGTI